MKRIFSIISLFLWYYKLMHNILMGTIGMLNMPTVDIQRDKTFVIGGSFLEKHSTTAC